MNTSDKKTLKIQQNRLPARQKESSSVSSDNVSSARFQNRVSNNKASVPSKKSASVKNPGASRRQKTDSSSHREPRARRRKRLRQKQVRKQKLFLAAALIVLLLAVTGGMIRFRQQPSEILTINSACEAYRQDVETIAAEYRMSDYTDLILALMMQESSGRGPDVLQSSEGAYNKKYPQVPNGITDTAYSIECGIQELKYAMEKAGVSSPTDMDRIRLALQAYNFGADVYFSYLEKNGITSWSEKTSEAFAKMASGETARSEDDPFYETAGPWDYGDQKYPEHVLRYYHP